MDHGGMPNMSMPMSPPGSGSMPMIMHMSFYWGNDVVILFKDWPNGNLSLYILALVFVFIIAATLEVLAMTSTVKPGMNPISGGVTQASIYAIRMALAYLVMLSVMSYNLGLFIVAVAGHALGFFVVKARAITQANANTTPKV